jgi:hypothetical protein
MNAKALAESFAGSSSHEQAKLLSAWMHALTLDARDTYIAGTEAIADPVRLRGMNEAQHRISGQLHKILCDDTDRYPDEVFMAMMLDVTKSLRANFLKSELEKMGEKAVQQGRTGRRAG